MDLDTAKENIQPLACGRNARYLEAALNNKSHQEILEERKHFEDAIRNYEGDDPLEPWFEYITWIEQSYPSGGKESGLEDVLLKCITNFEADQRYYQDRRMIKLYIKHIDTQQNPQEYYQELYNQGIGTMVADLYICWAYYYDLCGNFQKADSIFRKGLDARAQPYDELDQAHKHFGFTMSQRILYQDEGSQQEFIATLQERRQALTSLKHHKKKVGSIRTGSAIQSYNPGRVSVNSSKSRPNNSNLEVHVFEDQNRDPNPIVDVQPNDSVDASSSRSQSVIRSIIDSARKQENMREPGPWSKAKTNNHKKFPSISSSDRSLPFEILLDEHEETQSPLPSHPNNYIKGIQLGADHAIRNLPQKEWKVPICLETEILTHVYPMYNKIWAYPRPDHEYSIEEILAYKWYKKNRMENKTTKRLDAVWANDYSIGIRLYPNFARKNEPQAEFKVEKFLSDEPIVEKRAKFAIKIEEIYPENSSEEYQFEEILCSKVRNGERQLKFGLNSTRLMDEEMDETAIVTNAYGRKSIFPSRKSMAMRKSMYQHPSTEDHIEVLVPSSSSDITSIDSNKNSSLISYANAQSSSREVQKPVHENREPIIAPRTPKTSIFDENKLELAQARQQDFIFKTPAPANQFQIYEEEEAPRLSTKSLDIHGSQFKVNKPSTSLLSEQTSSNSNENKNIMSMQEEEQDFVFKPPAPAVKSKQFEIYEEEEVPTATSNTTFAANESCSTQTFNFFIKAQSVSTPKHIKKYQTHFTSVEPTSAIPSSLLESTPVTAEPPTPTIIYSPDFDNNQATILQPKQLSTIMETTESNTVSSGCGTTTTKFSVDTQISSPESDADSPRNYQSKTVVTTPETIPEESVEIAEESVARTKLKNISHLQQKDDTVSFMMMSLKPFEEKTETVTKAILVPKSSVDDDMCNLFTTTPPEKKTLIIKPKVGGFEINDSTKFSVKDFTLPKLDFDEDINQVFKSQKINADGLKGNNSIFTNNRELTLPDLNVVDEIKFQELSVSQCSEIRSKRQTLIPGFEDFDFRPKSNDIGFDSPSIPTRSEKKIGSNIPALPRAQPIKEIERGVKQRFLSNSKFENKKENLSQKISHAAINNESASKPCYTLPTFLAPKNDHFVSANQTINQSLRPSTSNKDMSSIFTRSEAVDEVGSDKVIIATQQQNVNTNSTSTTASNYSLSPPISNKDRRSIFVKSADMDVVRTDKPQQQEILRPNITVNPPIISHKNRPSIFVARSEPMENKSLIISDPQPLTNISMHATTKRQSEFFEDNIRTEAFAPNMTGIKNSTWLPNHMSGNISQIQEKSIHIKEEIDDSGSNCSGQSKKSILSRFSEISRRHSTILPTYLTGQGNNQHSKSSTATESKEKSTLKLFQNSKTDADRGKEEDGAFAIIDHEDEDLGRSIYFKNTPKTPMVGRHYWVDADNDDGNNNESFVQQNQFLIREIDLNHTRQIIGEYMLDANLNPFANELIGAFLEQIDFFGHLEQVPTCSFVNKIPALKKNGVVSLCDDHTFDILKIVGEGAYGTIFCAKERNTEKLFAIKQEKPPNFWEYYICLELKSRLNNVNIYPCFMDVEYAVIGQNSSLLISSYSKYGSLITVCNKVKRATSKNLDEYIVMMLTSQMLMIMDHLHASNIIHADIKPDNFLLISKLSYGNDIPVLQLIDFGISIDLALFPQGQTFQFSQKNDDFKCVEMRENRPWTFQTDLYGLAASVHVMLFGKYMDVEKRITGWTHKSRIPRYFHKAIWDTIFNMLLNIRDCKSMPNLQYLRTLLEEEIGSKENYLRDKIKEFNLAIEQ